MQVMEIELPGGLPANGRVERRARFLPLTGKVEQSLIESGGQQDRSSYVTRVLSQVLESIGDQVADAATVAR